jgi:hypothetical protein
MKLSRKQFWLLLQAIYISVLLLYQGLWLTSGLCTGKVVEIRKGTGDYKSMRYALIYYAVDGKVYDTEEIIDADYSDYKVGQELQMSYLPFAKGTARVKGSKADLFLIVGFYTIFLLFTAVILILPNYLLDRKCHFQIQRRRPFVRYVVEERRKKNYAIPLIERANLYAGYVERFMFPFIMCGCTALIVYLFSKSLFWLILLIVLGVFLGVFRARNWARNLRPHDPELDAVDISLNSTEE